ncbi:MAG: glycosyltransferase family 4 protein [Chloroflexi bacterium]|nr:MAG: glycosyltransferase family 4 protein [Chloroflexota bacterium]
MNATLRAVIATYDGEPPIGGQGVLVRGLRAALAARGVDVRMVAGHGEGALRYPRVTGRGPLDFSIALNRDPVPLLAAGPGLVHAQGGPGGVLLLRRLPVPVVYTAHHTYRQAYSPRRLQRAMSPLEARAYRRAALVMAVSPSTADAVRALGVGAGRIEVVPPGIDIDRLDHGEASREPRRLLFAGRLEPEKGALEAVAVMVAVSGAVAGVRGAVAGAGGLDSRVRAAAAAAPGGGVEVLGAVSDEELWRQYARAAVVLMPSRYEGLGLVALEAMGAGCAVVGYDVSGLRDALAGGAGVLVPAGDQAALVAACRSLLEDEARRSEIAERGRARVRERHAWDAIAGRVAEVYRAVLTPP